jgi:excisionase family DNA binding protein
MNSADASPPGARSVETLKAVYSLEEAMELLQVKRSEIYELMGSGELSYVQVSPRRRIIRGEHIAAFLEAHEVASAGMAGADS